jgi:hypothetical protein
MKLLAALLALPAIAFATPASAADWRLVSVSTDFRAAFFIDLDSLASEGSSVQRVSLLAVVAPGAKYAALQSDLKFDCSANKIRLGRSVAYADTGSVIEVDQEDPAEPWEVMLANSNFLNSADIACGRKPVSEDRYGPGMPIASGRALLVKRAQAQAT